MSTAAKPAMTASDVVVLTFAEAPQPVFREVRGGAYVKFGVDNLYPFFLQSLFDKATKHGAIVSNKATYIAGNGWKAKDGAANAQADAFIAKVNRYGESLSDITRKVALDLEIFGGAYLQIIWSNAGGRIAELYHIDNTRIRSNADNTQFHYREDWRISDAVHRARTRGRRKIYPAFNPANPHGSQILYLKEYRPGADTYALPTYMRALNYIGAEIEVSRHTLGNSQSGFTPSKSITLTNGEPEDEEKKKITKKFEKAYTGTEGRKFLLWFTSNADKKPIIDDLGASDLTKEDFTAVDTLIQTNIFTGHQITTPALFGIATPGALGQRTELRDGYEIFKKTYVNGKQQFLESAINRLAAAAGVPVKLEIIPTEPVGIDVASVQHIAPKSWVLEQLGIDPAKYPDGPAGSTAQPAQMDAAATMPTNDAIRNLTAKQHQQLMRIIRQVSKGQLTEAAATVLLRSSLGLSDEDIASVLGIGDSLPAAMSDNEPLELSEDDKAIAVFAEYGVAPDGFMIVKSKRVKYADDADAEVREHAYLSFIAGTTNTVEASVLDLISKDKRITPEIIAKTIGTDESTVLDILKSLTDAGELKVSGDARTLTKPLKELQDGATAKTKSFRVMYGYTGPQDSKNRPFRAKLMQLGRFYTRTEIESISTRLGYSVWDRRGGFYTNPTTGDTTPYCRHTWMSHVVLAKPAAEA